MRDRKQKKIRIRLKPDDPVLVVDGRQGLQALEAQHQRAVEEWRKSCKGWGYQLKRIHGIEYLYRWETKPGGKRWTYIGRADEVHRSKEDELPEPPVDPLLGIKYRYTGPTWKWENPHVLLSWGDYQTLAEHFADCPTFPIRAELNGTKLT